jgi:Pyruvate/2-oxoacid:ferredoxin oxidoreductase delta subunit
MADVRRGVIAAIDRETCTGCSQCRLNCPSRAIAREGLQCRVVAELCRGCLECRWVCPNRCIAAVNGPQGSPATM